MPKAVIFVPGIQGSELTEGATLRWPSFKAKDIERLMDASVELKADTVLREVERPFGLPSVPVYGPLLDQMALRGHDVVPFAYDWRRSILDHVDNLWLQILTESERMGQKVSLVCHSMGALLTKAVLVEKPDAALYVDKVITMGAPWRGAPQAYRVLKFGEMWPDERWFMYYGAALGFGGRPATPDLMAKVARTCASAYQLLPSREYFAHCPEDGYLIPTAKEIACGADESHRTIDADPDFPGNPFSVHAAVLHASMRRRWPEAISHHAVIGHGIDSIGQICEEPAYYLKQYKGNKTTRKARARWIDGDKTVPVVSATPPLDHNADVRYVVEHHERLPVNTAVRTWVCNILAGSPELDIPGLTRNIEEDNRLKNMVMVSCPVDVNMAFGGDREPVDDEAFNWSDPLGAEVEVYQLGETRYISVPAGRNYSVDMQSYGEGPLNVGIETLKAGQVVSSAQFPEVQLSASIAAKLVISGDTTPTLQIRDSRKHIARIIEPVVTDDPVRLRDHTPPEVNILVEPQGGGAAVGRVAHGYCQLHLQVTDRETPILDAFYRINEGPWVKYPRHPVPLTEWGVLVIEAYATDSLRNRSRHLARRTVRLTDPARHLRPHVEYHSAAIEVFLRTYEGTDPETELVAYYWINEGAPQHYTGEPIRLDYDRGDTKLSYMVNAFLHPDLEEQTVIIRTADIQKAVWGSGHPVTAGELAILVGENPDEAVDPVLLDARKFPMDFNLRAITNSNVLSMEYPEVTYTFDLRPTYECYIQGNEIIPQGQLVHVEFQMVDHDRQVTYPEIYLKLHVKKGQKYFEFGTLIPTVRDDGWYVFDLNTEEHLPAGETSFRIDFWDHRRRLRSKALLLK